MANTKISDLPGTTTLTDEDAIPVVQEGITKKFTGVLTALKTLLGIGNPETLQTQSKEVVGAVNELNGKRQWTEQGEYTGNSIPAVSDSSAVDLLYEISDGFSGYSLMFRKNASYVIRGRAYGANNNTYIDYVYNIWASNPFSFTAAIKDGSDVLSSITTRVSYR